jgi:type VI protein secretion system component VasF
MAAPAERRHTIRPKPNTAETLQRALASWRRLQAAWTVTLQGAEAVQNSERMALAKSKLDECQSEITRIERLLGQRPS